MIAPLGFRVGVCERVCDGGGPVLFAPLFRQSLWWLCIEIKRMHGIKFVKVVGNYLPVFDNLFMARCLLMRL